MSETVHLTGTLTGTLSGDDGTNAISIPTSWPVSADFVITPDMVTARPGPPALQGTVHHIAAGGGDQTATIQAAINSAAAGDTIFFDSGAHTVNGVITAASNLLYIGPTVQFSGQARAVLQFTNSTWPGTVNFQINNGSNITMYGLTLMSCQVGINSCTNFKMTNCIMDMQNETSGADVMNFGGVSNATISWNTFQNAAGVGNNGAGGSCDNVMFTRNKLLHCRQPVSWSPDTNAASNSNNVLTFNYMQSVTRAGIEIQGANPNLPTHGWKINDNYVDGINSVASDFKIGFSIVSANDAEIARNYCFFNTTQQNCAGIEFSCAPNSGSVHDNYIDGQNSPGSVGIFGGYAPADQTVVTNNNVIRCATVYYSAGGGGVFSGFTSVDRGKPPIPDGGAGT